MSGVQLSELFKDHRKDSNVMKHNFADPPIMKDQIWAAIRKMKLDKATSPHRISVELLEALEDYGIDKITKLLKEIYDTSDSTTHLQIYDYSMSKKPGATKCMLHRTTSRRSHIIKIILRVIMMQVGNKIKPKIVGEQ